MPEFYIIIDRKIFSRFCWGSGRARAPTPYPTPMINSMVSTHHIVHVCDRKTDERTDGQNCFCLGLHLFKSDLPSTLTLVSKARVRTES